MMWNEKDEKWRGEGEDAELNSHWPKNIHTSHSLCICATLTGWIVRHSAIEFWWDNFLHVYYPIRPGISAWTQVIILYQKITISITALAEAADGCGVHPSPAFLLNPTPTFIYSKPRIRGRGGGRNAMDNKLLLPEDKERVLPVSKKRQKLDYNIFKYLLKKNPDSSLVWINACILNCIVVLIYGTDGMDDI